MMHFATPLFAFDCNFNRYTTNDFAIYFSSAHDLAQKLTAANEDELLLVGGNMARIAYEKYRWNKIGKQYFDLLLGLPRLS